jgi:hypothetical protein
MRVALHLVGQVRSKLKHRLWQPNAVPARQAPDAAALLLHDFFVLIRVDAVHCHQMVAPQN